MTDNYPIMKAPSPIFSWISSFGVPAQVYYIAERISGEEVTGICAEVKTITASGKDNEELYFLFLFESCATVLILAPYRGICNGFRKEEMSLYLQNVRETIENMALQLLDECKRVKDELYSDITMKTEKQYRNSYPELRTDN